MKKFGILLCAALLALMLGGCAAEDEAGYTEYQGVKIPNLEIENMRFFATYDGAPTVPTDEQLLAAAAYEQVQVDEAERLGLLPSMAAAETYYMERLVKPTMQSLTDDDPMIREIGIFSLETWQARREQLGLTHEAYCDFLITHWQRVMGMNALLEHFTSQPEALSRRGFRPGEPWVDTYGEYVDGLLAQAAQAAAEN